MMTTQRVALDLVAPGDANPEDPVDDGCTHSWVARTSRGVPFVVYCTRAADHEGEQHVAAGPDSILAVQPWT